MCGIAVALQTSEAQANVERMLTRLSHRGEVTDPIFSPHARLAMGTRRLRIVDGPHGAQPISSSDGRLRVVFNGEIYNHAELRRELIAAGAAFRSLCDTEVVATALQVWGAGALSRFEGMFALVAIDLKTGDWLAARDPLGVRPLYVIENPDGGRLFCSELGALLHATDEGIALPLPPGRLLTADGCYLYTPRWRTPLPSDGADILHLLGRAVERRLPEDLPAAVLFSGGLDSTLILHLAREFAPSTAAYVLGDPGAPDLEPAQRYAERQGVDLRVVALEEAGLPELSQIDEVVRRVETFEPETVRNGRCTLKIARAMASDEFKVGLCGEGADELFAGYRPLEVGFLAGDAPGVALRDQCLETMDITVLQRLDRCGLAHGVELREPFLDASIVRAALGMRRAELLSGADEQSTGKAPLREAGRLLGLPDEIRLRPKRPLNEGSGADRGQDQSSWIEAAEALVSDAELADGRQRYAGFGVQTKEELLYLERLQLVIDLDRAPHLARRAHLFLPQEVSASSLAEFVVADEPTNRR